MPEMLTAEELREFRAMKDAWPAVQDALKMGTTLQSSYDGHLHRETVIQERGAGAPTHTAKQGTIYIDDTNDQFYFNTDGSTGWQNVGGGGVAGQHTILTGPTGTHTDTNSLVTLVQGDMQVVASNLLWDRLQFSQGLGKNAVLGSTTGTSPSWVDRTIHSVGVVESKTISSGSVTVTRSHVSVSPETVGVADDLDNIDGAAALLGSGHIMFLFNASTTVNITLKHITGTGPKRIFFPDSADVALKPITGIWLVSETFGWTPVAPAYHSAYTDADAVAAVPFEIWMPLGHDRGGQPMQA